MKIAYCLAGLFNSAGMERIVTDKANWLSKHGHEVAIITAEQRGREPYYKLRENVRTIDLGINYSGNSSFLMKLFSYPFKALRHRKRLRRMLKQLNLDITITTLGNEFLFLYKIPYGGKKIAEIHFTRYYRKLWKSGFLTGLVDNFRSRQESKKMGKYDRFVVLTEEDSRNWPELKNVSVIPNFIERTELARSIGLNKRFICVGRLNYQKGIDLLIEACRIVKDKLYGWHVDIYGSGEEESKLQSQIDDYGLSEIVRINKPTKNIYAEYAKSDALLMTSRFEGLPMVLLEAMSAGLPAISFRCPCGPADIITDGCGILVENGNVEEFAKAMADVIDNPDSLKEMGRKSQYRAENFEKDTVMRKWEDLFNTLTTNN